jgi:sigma-B regulation protein RsbU (phosphoserine phosphatase)
MLIGLEDGVSFHIARGLDQRTIEQPEFQVSRGVIDRVIETWEAVLTSNAQNDPRFDSSKSIRGLQLRSIMCAPMQVKEKLIGVIYVDNRLVSGIFRDLDLSFLNAIANSAGAAVENARLYQIALDQAKMEEEMRMARNIQVSLLPETPPALAGWNFVASWIPARQVSGDFYDFIDMSDGKQGFVIGDVTDKGLPAGLFMVFARSALRKALENHSHPAQAMIAANQTICTEARMGLYVTLIFGALDPEKGELTFINAGHNPALHYRVAQSRIERLMPTGIPMGIDETFTFHQKTIQLEPGDFIVLYTDGITEAINRVEEEYGTERLESVVFANRNQAMGEISTAIQDSVKAFAQECFPFDDTTLLLVGRE